MARGTYEQAPVQKSKSNEAMYQVPIYKTGDPAVDAATIALYQKNGYKYAGEDKLGTVILEISKSGAEQIGLDGIARHNSYAQGAKKVDMGGSATLIQNDTFRANNPMTADQLMAEIGGGDSTPDDMDDEL